MKANKLLKVLSAATIISTLAVVDYSATTQNNKVLLAADTQNPEVDVKVTALNAYEAGKTSMANASIVKLTVQKVSNGYKYKLILKDIKVGELTDGVSKLWIEGKETPLQPIEYTGNPKVINPKLAEFTLSELKPQIKATVFVKIMEDLGMLSGTSGQGKKDTILSLDLTGVQEKLTPKSVESPKPATSTPVKPAETKPTPKSETAENTQPTNKPAGPAATKPTETVKPVETTKPTEPAKPVETTKPKEPTKPVVTKTTPKPTPSATATFYKGVKATLLNAYQPDRRSMGDAALEHNNVTVFKEGSTYHYIVRFHNISVGTFNDGITGFWVNGIEYPVNPTGRANKQVEVHFTSNKKLSTVPVSVFVQAMETIMPGGGKQNATLSFDWSNVTEEQGQPIAGGKPGTSDASNGAGASTPKGGRLNNGRLSNTGLETSSSILAGALTLISAVLVGRRKQK
ncbi:MAG: hypothetical protein E6510_01775 [Gemella haemolysans]|uniref:hypothetical protein n=1 Tax=Gemella haemolysans TaxID=1379 RepID=UPI0029127FBC|nr:hypothetical protein [Gemella haemolysans]MDU6572921.1 hypothetical protein [Gemella haemolysans]